MLNFFIGIAFKNEISVADIISILAIIISLITLIFLFVQRKDSTKCRIVLLKDNSDFIYDKSNFSFSKTNIMLKIIGGTCAEQIIVKGNMLYDNRKIANRVYRSVDSCKLLAVNNQIEIDYLDNTAPYNLNSFLYPYIFAMGDIFYNLCLTGEFESKYNLLTLYLDICYKDINGYSYNNYYLIKPNLTLMNFETKSCMYGLFLKRINKKEYKKSIKKC